MTDTGRLQTFVTPDLIRGDEEVQGIFSLHVIII